MLHKMLVLLLLLPGISHAQSCPLIAKLPDADCNTQLVVSVLGDSLVYGTGDTANGNHGGYVKRLFS